MFCIYNFGQCIRVVKVKSGTVCTCEIFCQVWMVHQAMAGKLYTFQSNRNMDVIKPKKPQQTQVVKIFQHDLAVETFFFSVCVHWVTDHWMCCAWAVPPKVALPERFVLWSELWILCTKHLGQKLHNLQALVVIIALQNTQGSPGDITAESKARGH